MVAYSTKIAANRVIEVVISGSDLDLTAANQTAQNISATLPAGMLPTSVLITKGSTASTSSQTLTNLNLAIGSTAAGTDILTAKDVKGASANIFSATAATAFLSATDDKRIYISFTPTGSGSNFDTITFGSDVTVRINCVRVTGDNL